MNKFLICLFAALAGTAALPANAQDMATATVTSVTIAPPQSPLALNIKTALSAAYYGAP